MDVQASIRFTCDFVGAGVHTGPVWHWVFGPAAQAAHSPHRIKTQNQPGGV